MIYMQKHEKERVNYSTGEIEEVNDNFVQIYVDKLDLIIEMTSENPTAVKVFTWLLKHMDKRNALVISQQALSEGLGIGRTTVYTSIEYLKQKKAIAVFKSGNTNIYAVNVQIAWKSNAGGKRYAMFDAKVYISYTEQEEEKPLFKTELIGHSIKKEPKKKIVKKKRTS
jgi:Firmicute plasmid replication protein (RepL)